MDRLAGTGQLMSLAGEVEHRGRDLAVFESAEHLLAARSGRGPQVRAPFDQHQRSRYFVDVSDRRAGFVIGFVLPRRGPEPVVLKLREIGDVPEIAPVGDGAL